MNTKLTIRSIYAAILLGWAGASGALSLGPVSGSTVVGRPLELTAPIQLDEAGAPDCVQAELMYGDKAVDAAKVQVNLSRDAGRQTAIARISSLTVVNEPVVTVMLKVGCGRQSTRRYVVLAEPPKEEPMLLAAASSFASIAAVRVGLATTVAVAPPRRGAAAPRSSRNSTTTMAASPLRERSVGSVTRDIGTARPSRLQLAVWDPSAPEGMPWLRASTQLLSTPSADSAHRAAAIALWRALNAQPQDLLRTAERLRGLEAEMSALRGLTGRHRSEILSARESLQAARSQDYANLILAMVLAMLAGGSAAFFWHRSRRAAAVAPYASWYPIEPRGESIVGGQPATAPVAARVMTGPVVIPASLKSPAIPAVEAKPFPAAKPLQEEEAPILSALEFTLPDTKVSSPARAADDSELPALKVEALHGAQQQSEFFASLGQYDEAIAVLSGYLTECSEKPALAFLELFRIYHGLEMRQEYQGLQAAFCVTYGFEAASYDQFKDDRRELELFPVPVARISASWPSEAALDVIEEILFKPPTSARDMLSLEALRELVWLYALAQDIVHSNGMPAGLQLLGDTSLPTNHFILPWAVSGDQGPPELSLDQLNSIDVAPALSGFGVDIDLTAAPSGAVQQTVKEKQAPAGIRAPQDTGSAFDAVMEAQSRKH